MNKSFKVFLLIVLIFGFIEIGNDFLTGLYGMPYINWGVLLFLLSFPLFFAYLKLLGTKYIRIQIMTDKSIKAMEMNGNNLSEISVVPDDVLAPLKKHSLERVDINHELGMVTFGYSFGRKWYE